MGVDAVYFERLWIHICTFERFNMVSNSLLAGQRTFFIDTQRDRSNLQLCIGLVVESASLYVYDNGQEAAETIAHWDEISILTHVR